MKSPEERIMLSVLNQAIKDYREGDTELRKEVIEWIHNKKGTFELCAQSWDKSPEFLEEMLLHKFREFDFKRLLKRANELVAEFYKEGDRVFRVQLRDTVKSLDNSFCTTLLKELDKIDKLKSSTGEKMGGLSGADGSPIIKKCSQCDKENIEVVKDILGNIICLECLENNQNYGAYDKQD